MVMKAESMSKTQKMWQLVFVLPFLPLVFSLVVLFGGVYYIVKALCFVIEQPLKFFGVIYQCDSLLDTYSESCAKRAKHGLPAPRGDSW